MTTNIYSEVLKTAFSPFAKGCRVLNRKTNGVLYVGLLVIVFLLILFALTEWVGIEPIQTRNY